MNTFKPTLKKKVPILNKRAAKNSKWSMTTAPSIPRTCRCDLGGGKFALLTKFSSWLGACLIEDHYSQVRGIYTRWTVGEGWHHWQIVIVQARPETVQSQRVRTSCVAITSSPKVRLVTAAVLGVPAKGKPR